MYRYSVDNAVTYTSEDVVLFREAPFASWMERLSLENPDHGIPPDVGSQPPENTMERQDDIAETLRAEGKLVSLIDWGEDESRRRAATLDAMRQGADFIVNGQLALGPLSGSANLLMRTSGYSELGDFLYIPCDTQAKTTLHSAFRLCFLADLLHSLQGQLPPQMLVIRGGDDLVPLQTDDHIYHYRAVKLRFMAAMSNFRKHKMPDPAESSHFGRWSDCAHEVLKQRMLHQDQQQPGYALENIEEGAEHNEPMLQAVGSSLQPGASPYDLDDNNRPPETAPGHDATATLSVAARAPGSVTARKSTGTAPAGPTLAEQASLLAPDSFTAGPGDSRCRPVAPVTADSAPAVPGPAEPGLPGQDRPQPEHNRRASDEALQNLQFIGSSRQPPVIGGRTSPQDQPEPEQQSSSVFSSAPAPSLRDPRVGVTPQPEVALAAAPDPVLDKFTDFAELMSVEAALKEPGVNPARASGAGPDSAARSAVDMDSDHAVFRDPVLRDPVLRDPVLRDPGSPPPELPTGYAAYYPGESPTDTVDSDDKLASRPVFDERFVEHDREPRATDVFSDSLMTSDNYDD